MPWAIHKNCRGCPPSKPWGVVRQTDGKLEGCSISLEMAKKHLAALHIHSHDASAAPIPTPTTAAAKSITIDSLNNPNDLADVPTPALDRLHAQLHALDLKLLEEGVAREYRTVHRHLWIVEELRHRKAPHPDEPSNRLDEDTNYFLSLLAAALPDWLASTLNDTGIQILVPAYVNLVGSSVDATDPHDLDVLIREDPENLTKGWRESVMLLVREALRESTGDKYNIHILGNPQGPHVANDRGYVPMYDLALIPRAPDAPTYEVPQTSTDGYGTSTDGYSSSITAAAFTPGAHYTLTKPKVAIYSDFTSIEEMWDKWANEALTQAGALFVSPKVDGLRTSDWHIHDAIHIWSEDYKRDFSHLKPLAPLAADLTHAPQCVIEGELMVRGPDGYYARPQIATFLTGKLDGTPHVFLYDILFDGHDIHDRPWVERIKHLNVLGHGLGDHYSVLPQSRVTSKDTLFREAKKMANWTGQGSPQIEGVVVRRADQPYKFGVDNAYSKTKKYVEVKLRVLAVSHVPNGYTYEVGALDSGDKVISLGKTFVSKSKLAGVGDTLNVHVEEILDHDGQIATGKPTPLGIDRSRGPYTVAQIINLATRFGVLKKYSGAAVPIDESTPTKAAIVATSSGSTPAPPHGPHNAKLAIIGDAPGRIERSTGIPLSGPSGKFLKDLLASQHVDPESVYYLNVYDGDEGAITDAKTAKLGQRLLERLNKLPDLQAALAIGQLPGQAFTGQKAPIDVYRQADIVTRTKLPVIITYHPSAIMRTGQKSSRFYRPFRADVLEATRLAHLHPHAASLLGYALDSEEVLLADSAKGRAAELNWERNWQDAIPLGSGTQPFIEHMHFRGLQEDETKLGIDELNAHHRSVHLDLRLGTDRFPGWFGITQEGDRAKLNDFFRQGRGHIRTSVKQFGPRAWLKIGVPNPHIVEPGGVGSYPDTWAKFFAIDRGKWHVGYARKHSVEIFLQGSTMKGRYMWEYVPFAGTRVWNIIKPTDQRPFAQTHKIATVISDLRRKGQRYLVWPKNPSNLTAGMHLIDTKTGEPVAPRSSQPAPGEEGVA